MFAAVINDLNPFWVCQLSFDGGYYRIKRYIGRVFPKFNSKIFMKDIKTNICLWKGLNKNRSRYDFLLFKTVETGY